MNKPLITVSGLLVFAGVLYQYGPEAYANFKTYHIEQILEVMKDDRLLLAATAKGLEESVIRSNLSDLRKEQYQLNELVRKGRKDKYITDRLATVTKEIERQEKRLCKVRGEC